MPTFTRRPSAVFPSSAWIAYIEEKGGSRFHNNLHLPAADLLFEYSQWAMQHFGVPSRDHVRLWRGINGFTEQRVVTGDRRERAPACCAQQRRVLSTSRERADEFGDWIPQRRFRWSRSRFSQTCFPSAPLAGENEVLVTAANTKWWPRRFDALLPALTRPCCPPACAPAACFDRAPGAHRLATGDALGATVEFMTPREIVAKHGRHRQMTAAAGCLRPVRVTDDCPTMSLAPRQGYPDAKGWYEGCRRSLLRRLRSKPSTAATPADAASGAT